MKNLIKSIIFLTIFIILLHVCSNIFELKGNGFGSDVISFYNLKKNSLDIIFFGSSHSYASFYPDVIEEETNLKSYNFATQQQPIYITYHYMIEALKSQRPKYFVLETLMTSIDDEYATEGVNRDALDKMKLSKNKIHKLAERQYRLHRNSTIFYIAKNTMRLGMMAINMILRIKINTNHYRQA